MKVKDLRRLLKEMVTDELDEMARIAKKTSIPDKELFDKAKEQVKGTWYYDLLTFIENNPDATELEMAHAMGKSSQQQINGVLRKFKDKGIISQGEHIVAPTERPEVRPGAIGRINRGIGEKKENMKQIMRLLRAKTEVPEDLKAKVTPEEYQTLVDRASVETRGRRPGQQDTAKVTKDIENDPSIHIVDDREERIAKKAAKEEEAQQAMLDLQNHEKAMTDLNNLRKKEKDPVKAAEMLDRLKVMTNTKKLLKKKVDEL